MALLLPLTSSFLKLPNSMQPRVRRRQERHKFSYLTMLCTCVFPFWYILQSFSCYLRREMTCSELYRGLEHLTFFSDLQLILINSRIVRRHFASMNWNYGAIMAETRGYIFRWRCLSSTSYLLKLPNIQLFLIWLHGVESDLWFAFL